MKKNFMPLFPCLILATAFLSACSPPQPEQAPVALSIVLCRTANANDFTDNMLSEITPWIKRAVYGGRISVIICDGEPHEIKTFGRDVFPTNAKSRQYMNNLIERRTKEVLSFMQDPSVRAITEEVDVLGAIVQAELSLNAADARGLERKLAVLGSGIPTTGFLSLQDFRLEENSAENGYIDAFVSALAARRGIIPPLNDVQICWVGMGNVAHPQRLPSTIGIQLQELWRTILRESGAVFEDSDIRIMATGGKPNVYCEGEGGFPFVSTVFFDTPVVLPPPPTVVFDEHRDVPVFEIRSDQVAFVPDQATFRNESNARAVLQEYANWLVKYFKVFPDSYIYIAGFHARITPEGGNRLNTGLSERRAEAVRSMLIEFNVPEQRLIAVGLGINGGSHFREDEYPNDVFCNSCAQNNRYVMLVPDLSEHAPILKEVMAELDALRN